MTTKPSVQQYVNESADPSLKVYADNAQAVPVVTGNTAVFITNVNEYIVNNITSPGEPAGNSTEVQFNLNGRMDGDDGLTYNPTTDSLTVIGNLDAGAVLTDSLKYANGVAWNLNGNYSNSNVFSYLPTYVGNLNPNIVTATLFAGSGANLTNVPAGNIVGSVAVAAVANSVAGANVTGTVASATVAASANTVAGANVTGTVSSATSATTATRAGTVTTNAQPNITSVGSLSGLVVSNATGVVDFTTTANVSLGLLGNLHITGGASGQMITTNGSGTLSWTTPTVGNLQDVTTNGGTTSVAIEITNSSVSTNYNNGALKVTGGVGVGGNIHINSHLAAAQQVYAGHLSDFGSWLNPLFVGRSAGANYVQSAMINTNTEGSADWVAYGDSSTTDTGWVDMGYTGTAFNDPLYTITKASDGYVFSQGLDVSHGGPQGGNLVLATGSQGANSDIVFALGSFYANAEFARMDHDSNTFYVGGHAYGVTIDNPTPLVANLNVNGNTAIGGNANVTGNITVNGNIFGDNSGAPLVIDAGTTGDSYVSIPSFADGGEQLAIVNKYSTAGTNSIRLETTGGNFMFTNDDRLILSGGAILDSVDSNFEVRGIENVNFEANSAVNIYTDTSGSGQQWIFDNGGKLSLPGNVYSSSYKNKIYSNYGVVLEPTYNGSGNAPALYVSYNDGISIMPVTNDYLNGGGQTSPLYIEGNYANSGTAEPGGVFIDGGYNSNTTTAGNVYFGTLRAGSVNIGKSGTNVNITGTVTVSATLKTTATTLATLGSASSAGAGTRAFITDGNLVAAGNFGAVVGGSSGNSVPVYSDGTDWRIG